MTEWKRTKSRVHGNGQSYNCTNIVNAETLQNTLNSYENIIKELQDQIQTTKNYKELKKQLTALQMDLKVVQNDLDKIKELIK